MSRPLRPLHRWVCRRRRAPRQPWPQWYHRRRFLPRL